MGAETGDGILSLFSVSFAPGEGGGVLPYMGYIGMCCSEGYGFQAVYSRIGYIIRKFGSRIGYHFSGRDWGNSYSKVGGIWGVYSSIG